LARKVDATAETRVLYHEGKTLRSTDSSNADVGTPLLVNRFKMRAILEDTQSRTFPL